MTAPTTASPSPLAMLMRASAVFKQNGHARPEPYVLVYGMDADRSENIRERLLRRHVLNVMPIFREGELDVFLAERTGDVAVIILDRKLCGKADKNIREKLPDARVVYITPEMDADAVAEETQKSSGG